MIELGTILVVYQGFVKCSLILIQTAILVYTFDDFEVFSSYKLLCILVCIISHYCELPMSYFPYQFGWECSEEWYSKL